MNTPDRAGPSPVSPGTLYVVATPIGNLGDFSPRAVETLRAVDFIAAEDTRMGAKLLHRFGIDTPQISYFEHNRRQKGEHIVARLAAGQSCALITDAGTPAISDPGADLVALCRQAGIPAVAVPGCSALTAALSISGMACGRFTFEGFLSTNAKNRRVHLAELAGERRTMVFYEAPHKLRATLADLLAAFGDRPVTLCREITKLHEQVLSLTLSQAVAHFEQTAPRGEFVLVVAGAEAPRGEAADALLPDYIDMVERLVREDGLGLAEAARQVAARYGVPKNRLYRQALEKLGR